MSERARTYLPFLPPLALMALIFALSAMPNTDPEGGTVRLILRKCAHFSEFALLAALWWRALAGRIGGRRALYPAVVIAIVYAISDEFHQTFVETRVGTVWDVLIDSAGALTAAWLIERRRRVRRREAARA